MTDNRTTELLRKLLDERGVKYSDFTSATRNGKAIFKTRWKHERGYAELSEWESTGSNNLFIQNVDPEQAIAATLGVDVKDCENLLWEFIGALDVADATDADKKPIVAEYARHIAATLGGGKLTAEQVRETVEKHWHDLSANYDMPEATALPEYSYDWQAIADELNATIDGDECEWALREKWPNRTGDDHVYGYETGCGARHTWWPDSLPKFCPTCGGKVKAVK